ncbi:monovalent cation/H+ antiporter complex subunit F [Demequina sp. SO4-18]|uniref:monovalent cation/H+ antiporter complex subunit F n=1 Tax=Demequina sp. SO4-18 TaxID=3401026 RepID=UPI003B59E594
MIGLVIGIALVGLAAVATVYRMVKGPTDAERAIAGDLLMFCVIAMLALFGVMLSTPSAFEIVLVAALLGFLSTIAFARALTRGRR